MASLNSTWTSVEYPDIEAPFPSVRMRKRAVQLSRASSKVPTRVALKFKYRVRARRTYSRRRASTGSICAALRAGKKPKTTPIVMLTTEATTSELLEI